MNFWERGVVFIFGKSPGVSLVWNVSIIAFTNGELTKHASPKITTVSQHGVFMGELTMDYFLKRVNNPEAREPSLKVIKTSLIQRETTKRLS